MELKYQELIDEQGVNGPCPPAECLENKEVFAARWVLSPIDNEYNFLPNHLYIQRRGGVSKPNNDEKMRLLQFIISRKRKGFQDELQWYG